MCRHTLLGNHCSCCDITSDEQEICHTLLGNHCSCCVITSDEQEICVDIHCLGTIVVAVSLLQMSKRYV